RAYLLPGESPASAVPGFFLLATLGAMMAVSAAEMISLFLSLELLAVNLYVLTALARRGAGAISASLGYLVVGTASSGLLLYGMALVFGLSGETNLSAAGRALASVNPNQAAALLALSLLLGGLAFRMGLLPVRWWTRGFEVGIPLRVLIFVESVGVVAALAVFGRFATATFSGTGIAYPAVIAAVAALSLAGLPPVAGFFGKLLVLQAAVDGGYAWLAVIGVANIVLAAFGYLRIIRTAFLDSPVFEVVPVRLDGGIRTTVGLASIGIVFMGLLMGPLYAAASYGRAALLH